MTKIETTYLTLNSVQKPLVNTSIPHTYQLSVTIWVFISVLPMSPTAHKLYNEFVLSIAGSVHNKGPSIGPLLHAHVHQSIISWTTLGSSIQ